MTNPFELAEVEIKDIGGAFIVFINGHQVQFVTECSVESQEDCFDWVTISFPARVIKNN